MGSSRYFYVFLVFTCIVNLYASIASEGNNSNFIQTYLTHIPAVDREKEIPFQVPDENWIATALKDIAYFLRNNKFNDWDRRYYKNKPSDDSIGFYKAFPNRPLKILHWKVLDNCYQNFYKCIIYLHSVVETTPFRRIDDITTKLNANIIPRDNFTIKKTNNECQDALLNSDKTGIPFDGPKEKFRWRISASYFMCWYTMLEIPALSMLEERCDNFANCLDPIYGARNRDPRADDRQSFVCAIYSFCPDPCCPMKHARNISECHENIGNPCFFGNTGSSNVTCRLDRKDNQNFEDIMNNKWNTSCYCKDKGFEWRSNFGMCVDVNECLVGINNCDSESEVCLNLPGSFQCVCKWNFYFDNKTKSCIKLYVRN